MLRDDSIRSTSSIMSGLVNEEPQRDNNNNGGRATAEEEEGEEVLLPEASSKEEGDDDEYGLSVEGTVPVGITIAYRHQQKGFDEKMLRTSSATNSSPTNDSSALFKKMKHSGSTSSPNSTKKATSNKKKAEESNHEKTKQGSSSFQVFLESAAIYFLCLVLPTALGYLYSWYDVWRYEREKGGRLSEEDGYYSSYYEYLLNYQWFMSGVYDPLQSFMCDDGGSDASYSWSLVSSMMAKTGLCAGPNPNSVDQKRSVLSDDVSAGNDVVTIAVCSCLLAVVRIGIVQYTVPMEDADKVEAMVRVKSDHFLRSNYMLTPAGTPMQKKTIHQIPDLSQAGLHLPSLNDPVSNEAPEDDMFGVHIDASEREDIPATSLRPLTAGHQGKSSIQSMPQEDSAAGSLAKHDASQAPIPAANPVSGRNKKRLYAAPRYATALFRLLYSTVTAAIALIYFRGADFWPWYVLGHGSTVKCWDLSGGMSVGMDSDFDQVCSCDVRLFVVAVVLFGIIHSAQTTSYLLYTAQCGVETIFLVASELSLAFGGLSHFELAHPVASSNQTRAPSVFEFPNQFDCLCALFGTTCCIRRLDCGSLRL